jgi:hypothetical protein
MTALIAPIEYDRRRAGNHAPHYVTKPRRRK